MSRKLYRRADRFSSMSRRNCSRSRLRPARHHRSLDTPPAGNLVYDTRGKRAWRAHARTSLVAGRWRDRSDGDWHLLTLPCPEASAATVWNKGWIVSTLGLALRPMAVHAVRTDIIVEYAVRDWPGRPGGQPRGLGRPPVQPFWPGCCHAICAGRKLAAGTGGSYRVGPRHDQDSPLAAGSQSSVTASGTATACGGRGHAPRSTTQPAALER